MMDTISIFTTFFPIVSLAAIMVIIAYLLVLAKRLVEAIEKIAEKM